MSEQQTTAEPTEQSIEDAISAKLFPEPKKPDSKADTTPEDDDDEVTEDEPGEEESEQDEPEAKAEPATTEFELTYNGEPVRVPLDEAKALAQLGYHTKQNHEAVETQWKTVERVVADLEAVNKLAPELQEAEALVLAYKKALDGFDGEAMSQLARTDPAAYVEQRARWDQLGENFKQAKTARDALAKDVEQKKGALYAQKLAHERELLHKAMPHLKDPVKFAEERARVTAFFQSMGVTQEEARVIVDSNRLLQMAIKAARMDELQKSKSAKKIAPETPKVAKPGVASTARDVANQRTNALRSEIRNAKTDSEKAKGIQRLLEQRLR